MEPGQRDPQRLLADLAAEYERSTRFLQQLENCLTREQLETSVIPATPADGSVPEDDQPDALPTPDAKEALQSRPAVQFDPPSPPCPSQATTEPTPPESAPAKLRAKLRSLFARRVAIREGTQGQGQDPTPAPTQLQPQPQAQMQRPSPQQPPTPVQPSPPRQERGSGAPALARSISARRASMVQFSSDAAGPGGRGGAAGGRASMDVPDPGLSPAGNKVDRPVTGRRASVVYFGGALLDGPGRGGADLRIGIGGGGCEALDAPPPPAAPRRPTTAASARRASLVAVAQYGNTGAAGVAPEAGVSRAATPVPPAPIFLETDPDGAACGSDDAASTPPGGGGNAPTERPVTGGRRGSVVHFGGGVLESTDLSDLLPRRASSFHQQRSGVALTPTSARVRALNGSRRASVDVSQQYRTPMDIGQPYRASLDVGPQPYNHQLSGGPSRMSIEGPQQLGGCWQEQQQSSPQHSIQQQQLQQQQQLVGGTRRGSLDVGRPQSVRAATTGSTGGPGGGGGVGGSSNGSYSGAALNVVATSTLYLSSAPIGSQPQPHQPHARVQPLSQPLSQMPMVGVAWGAGPSPLHSPGAGPSSGGGPSSSGELGPQVPAASRAQRTTVAQQGPGEARRPCLSNSNSMRRRSGLVNEELGGAAAAATVGPVDSRRTSCGQVREPQVSPPPPLAVGYPDAVPAPYSGQASPTGAAAAAAPETPMRNRCAPALQQAAQPRMQSQHGTAVLHVGTTPVQHSVQHSQHLQQPQVHHQQQQTLIAAQAAQPAFLRVRSIVGSSQTISGGVEGVRARRASALVFGPQVVEEDHLGAVPVGGGGEALGR